MALDALMLVMFLFLFGSIFRDGLWSNTLTLINTVTAALLATNYFEPASAYLTDMVPAMVYNWDVIVLGVLFTAFYIALRQITSSLSKYHVLFPNRVDQLGSAVMAAWVSWIAVSFVLFMLHTSPLSRNFFYDGFQPEKKMFFGTGPDRDWAAFMQKTSNGMSWGRNAVDAEGRVTSVFDPDGEFLIKYTTRRTFLEKQESPFYGS